MMPLAKAWARWWVRNFESCSNETEIIMPRCLAVFIIMMGEPIQVGEMIARSIKGMITTADSYIGHPFVITTLCSRLGFPTEEYDDIAPPIDPIGLSFFRKAQRDLERAKAAFQGPHQPPPAPQQQQHQAPPHIPQQHQHSDFELGMAATLYEQHYMMDLGLPRYSPPLMTPVKGHIAQHPIPSYRH
jgi:hypothetical protein